MPLGLHGPAKTDCRTCLGRSPRASDLSIGKVARNSPRVRGEHSILAIELSDEEGEPAKHPSGSEWPTLVIQCSWRGALRNARAKHSLESVRYGRSRKRGVKGCPTLADLPQPTRQGRPWQRSTLLYFTLFSGMLVAGRVVKPASAILSALPISVIINAYKYLVTHMMNYI